MTYNNNGPIYSVLNAKDCPIIGGVQWVLRWFPTNASSDRHPDEPCCTATCIPPDDAAASAPETASEAACSANPICDSVGEV